MKSASTPIKARPQLPYSATASQQRQRRADASLLSRVARRVEAAVAKLNPLHRSAKDALPHTCTSPLNGLLHPGDIIRDLPFFTQSSEVNYFSTHPSLCEDAFGCAPGEVWEVMRVGSGVTAAVGQLLTIVGARGGRLWALMHGETSVRALHAPASTSEPGKGSSNSVREAIVAHYAAHLLFHPHRALTSAEAEEKNVLRGALALLPLHSSHGKDENGEAAAVRLLQQQQQQELTKHIQQARVAFSEVQQRAREEALRLYTAGQRAFLQCAPDLYVAAVPRLGTPPQSTECQGATMNGDDEDKGEEVRLSTTSGPAMSARPSTAAASASPPASAAHVSRAEVAADSTTTPSASVYAVVARGDAAAASVVLLAPRVMVAVGTVGWAGEGDVKLTAAQTGQECGEGSLSASVVI